MFCNSKSIRILVGVLLCATPSFGQATITTTHGPPGGWVNNIVLDRDGKLFVTVTEGAGDVMFESADDGNTWTRLAFPQARTGLGKMKISPDDRLYVTAQRDTSFVLYRSSDGTVNWESIFEGSSDLLGHAIHPDGTLYLAQRTKGVYRSSDGGATWHELTEGLTSLDIFSIEAVQDGDVFAGSISGEVYRLDREAGQWERIFASQASSEVIRVLKNAGGTIFVATTQDGVHRSTDGGSSWTKLTTQGNSIALLELAPDGTLFLDTYNLFGVARSEDDGDTWTEVNTGLSFRSGTHTTRYGVRGIAFGEQAYFAGTSNSGGVFRSNDRGATWQQTVFSNTDVRSLTVSSDGSIWAATNGTGFSRLRPNQQSWEKIAHQLHGGEVQFSVIRTGPDGALYVGSSRHLYRSDDNGANWAIIYTGETFDGIASLTFAGEGEVIIGTGGGRVLSSADRGDSWSVLAASLSSGTIHDVLATDDGYLFAAARREGLFRSVDNGVTWERLGSGLLSGTVTSLARGEQGDLFAGRIDAVFRSNDSGNTWQRLPFDTPEGTSIYRVRAIGHDVLMLATTAGIYHSADRGDTWAGPLAEWSDFSVLDILPMSDGTVYIGTQGGGVFRYSTTATSSVDDARKLMQLRPLHNYPNPFGAETTFSFDLSQPTWVTLAIYDMRGRKVADLVDGHHGAGRFAVRWDVRDTTLASGVYVARLRVGEITRSMTVIHVK